MIKTFDHEGDDTFAQDRELALLRPCECGCDNRDSDMIGYLHGIHDGKGFTIEILDEATYQVIAGVVS